MMEGPRRGLARVLGRGHLRPEAFPWVPLMLAAVLLAIGMVFVASIAESPSNQELRRISFEGHREKVLFALPMLVLGLLLRPRWLRQNAWVAYGFCLVLLVLVPFIGDERNNARRWIQLPKFDLQPSELAKVGVILMLARVLHENPLRTVRDWAAPLLTAAVPMGLVIMQPDLGTALTIVPVTLALLYLAGGSGKSIFGLVGAAALAGVLAVQSGSIQAYQLERIETWADSFEPAELIASRNGPAFHSFHARAFTGNGGLFGRGLGDGVANETGLLPERDCDSIFAVIAEEWGFVYTAVLLGLYTWMIIGLMVSASRLRERYSRLVVGGVAVYFAAHLVVNAAVNLGLLPMTGLTLPLLSTGGSSLLATFLALGLALGHASHHERNLGSDAFRRY